MGYFSWCVLIQFKNMPLMSSSGHDRCLLWHKRYDHLNLCYVSFLTNKKMVDGLLDTLEKQDNVCSTCLVGKRKRNPCDEGKDWGAKVLLELIHVDTCGPVKTISFSSAM
jgi:hypothetical protein